MILSGIEIERRLGEDIIISPFNKEQLSSHSYNLSLGDEIMVYSSPLLDIKKQSAVELIKIPPEGLVLEPNKLYLSKTLEYTETYNLVPEIQGRSSIARLGLFVHVNCPYGGIGFKGNWTLELSCVQPIKIYADIQICQVHYHEVVGDIVAYDSDKYQNSRKIEPSKLYMEFE